MLRELRDQAGLTRTELSDQTGRSVNFILKAEQLTFPVAPPSLVEYYAKHLGLDRDTIKSAYRDAQRSQRERFYEHFLPRPLTTQHFTFCRKWYVTPLKGDMPDTVSPNQYQVSKVLCVPASAVYYAEKNGTYSQALIDAVGDLLSYCRNGNLYSDIPEYKEAQYIHDGIERIWKEINA